jgi:OPA family glycerol-3-phosphate transporter-like MFS transporter
LTKPPPALTDELLPIVILVGVIALIVSRLPRVELGHSRAFRVRRALNWLPLGLTYAFLYMARYNLNVLKNVGGISQHTFGTIDGTAALVYGFSFLLNGPLADRWGGRVTILIAAAGAAVANVALGLMVMNHVESVTAYAIVFSINMYFQSFGAVSIVKVNAAWFHVRERGSFGGIFGILISLGIYFAYDWGTRITQVASYEWLFFVPAGFLVVFWVLSFLFVYDRPSAAGFADFELGDAPGSGKVERATAVIKRLITNPIILTLAFVEMCSGFLRQGILKWYPDFAHAIHGADATVVVDHWGMVSCIAGMTGGMFAGVISDHFFQSRRAPVSVVLYAIMLVGAIAIVPLLGGAPVLIGWVIAFMAMAIIGVHGMLSGTAAADFGGIKNAGVAVGLIDGFVYLGTAIQDFTYGNVLPEKKTPAAAELSNWYAWPIAMVPVALIGLVLAARLWHARPQQAPAKVVKVEPKAELPRAQIVAPDV